MKQFGAAVVLGLSVAVSAAAGSAREPVKVYVFAEKPEGGFVDEDSKQLAESVNDVAKNLAKKKDVTVVDKREGADVVVQVLERGMEPNGAASPGGLGIRTGKRVTKERYAPALRAKLTAGSYSDELLAQTTPDQVFHAWGTVANMMAKQIEKWVGTNYDRLIAARAPAGVTN